MKNRTKTKIMTVIVLAFMSVCVIGYIAVAADAGTTGDPVVTLSYLNDVFKKEILAAVGGNDAAQPGESSVSAFKVIEVDANKTLLGGEGCEFILRAGKATALCPGSDGLSDLTQGSDLKNAGNVEKNHHYLIPREDGRGITTSEYCYVMVKGSYTIK